LADEIQTPGSRRRFATNRPADNLVIDSIIGLDAALGVSAKRLPPALAMQAREATRAMARPSM
jgi:hypothetical protein